MKYLWIVLVIVFLIGTGYAKEPFISWSGQDTLFGGTGVKDTIKVDINLIDNQPQSGVFTLAIDLDTIKTGHAGVRPRVSAGYALALGKLIKGRANFDSLLIIHKDSAGVRTELEDSIKTPLNIPVYFNFSPAIKEHLRLFIIKDDTNADTTVVSYDLTSQ